MALCVSLNLFLSLFLRFLFNIYRHGPSKLQKKKKKIKYKENKKKEGLDMNM